MGVVCRGANKGHGKDRLSIQASSLRNASSSCDGDVCELKTFCG